MTQGQRINLQPLLEGALRVPRAVDRLGFALWLYVHLIRIAGSRGLVIRGRDHLAADLAVSEQTIDLWVERLAKAGLIRILSPSPYLALSLSFWPGQSPRSSAKQPLSRAEQEKYINARGSSKQSKQAAAAASLSKAGDGSAREGGPTAAEIREVLGEPNLDVASLLDGAPAHAVRRALSRVRLTAPERIRKSRTALFRYLLAKFSDEPHRDER